MAKYTIIKGLLAFSAVIAAYICLTLVFDLMSNNEYDAKTYLYPYFGFNQSAQPDSIPHATIDEHIYDIKNETELEALISNHEHDFNESNVTQFRNDRGV